MNIDKSIQILIVDDIDEVRICIIKNLRSLGFVNFTEARDGMQALQKIKSGTNSNLKFDLIISDINMPNLSGLELLKEVRTYSKTKTTKFILVSTENEKNIILEALVYNVSNYLIKPFNPEDFKSKILETLQR